MGKIITITDPQIKKILDEIKNLCEKEKTRAFLVGGPVRDLIMGKNLKKDLDICIEGNAIEFAQKLNKILKGKITRYPQFGTATIEIEDFRIDFAMTRKEEYPSPAVLPRVSFGKIEDDLFRRDFTINAIALDIKEEKLIDPFKGIDDIKAKKIRILHDKSFIDDPTRIFRAVRFAMRFSFEIEEKTEKLLKEAVSYIKLLTPERIRNEIKLILEEEKRYEMIKKLEEYGILSLLSLKLCDEENFKMADKFIEITKIKEDKWFYYYMLLLNPEKPVLYEPKYYEKKCANRLKEDISRAENLKRAKSNSEIYFCLKDVPMSNLCYIYANFKDVRQKIEKFLKELKDFRLKITGEDLKKMGLKPSPLFKQILDDVLSARIDGKIKEEDELNYAKERIKWLMDF